MSTLPRLLVIPLVALIATGLALGQSSRRDARRSNLEEEVDVRMVQVVLSVTDNDVDENASVRDIPVDDFIIKLDGKELTPGQKARTVIDQMCDEQITPDVVQEAMGRRIPDRPMILVVDFNYLDAQGRFNVARALRDAAATVADSQVEYKVYGYSRGLEILTPTKGFVKDPEELLVAARRVEETAYTSRGAQAVSEFDLEGPELPDLASEAGAGESPGLGAGGSATGSAAQADTGGGGDAIAGSLFDELGQESDFNPAASLGALERIMVIHSSIPWLKSIVLFTSDSFSFADPADEEHELNALLGDRHGYRVWPVVAEGLYTGYGDPPPTSRVLSTLSGNTGGRTLRNSGDLYMAIDGAAAQLSCYYLVSVPVPATKRARDYKLTVQLDREGKDEKTADDYFRYRLDWDRKTIRFTESVDRDRELRMAALFSPDDFPTPPLSVTIDYPGEHENLAASADESDEDRESRRARKRRHKIDRAVADIAIRFRIRLADLDWSQKAGTLWSAASTFSARFVPALVVERYDEWGSEVVCEFDVDKEGPFQTREIEIPLTGGRPRDDDPVAVSLAYVCPLSKMREGLYVARGIITDVGSDRIAADRSSLYLIEPEDEWRVLTPRIESVTSREIVYKAAQRETSWDLTGEETWRELRADDAARIDDRLALRYVLCGPEGEDPQQNIEHVVYRRGEDGARLEAFLNRRLLSLREEMQNGKKDLCPRAEVVIEPFTLTETGEYFVVTYRADVDKTALLDAIETVPPSKLEDVEGILAVVPFTVSE